MHCQPEHVIVIQDIVSDVRLQERACHWIDYVITQMIAVMEATNRIVDGHSIHTGKFEFCFNVYNRKQEHVLRVIYLFFYKWLSRSILNPTVLVCCLTRFRPVFHFREYTSGTLGWNYLRYKCLLLYFRCNFEYSLCYWRNLKDDQFDFTRTKGSTDSVGTGPLFDHTTGTGSGEVLSKTLIFVCSFL